MTSRPTFDPQFLENFTTKAVDDVVVIRRLGIRDIPVLLEFLRYSRHENNKVRDDDLVAAAEDELVFGAYLKTSSLLVGWAAILDLDETALSLPIAYELGALRTVLEHRRIGRALASARLHYLCTTEADASIFGITRGGAEVSRSFLHSFQFSTLEPEQAARLGLHRDGVQVHQATSRTAAAVAAQFLTFFDGPEPSFLYEPPQELADLLREARAILRSRGA